MDFWTSIYLCFFMIDLFNENTNKRNFQNILSLKMKFEEKIVLIFWFSDFFKISFMILLRKKKKSREFYTKSLWQRSFLNLQKISLWITKKKNSEKFFLKFFFQPRNFFSTPEPSPRIFYNSRQLWLIFYRSLIEFQLHYNFDSSI